MNTRIFFLLFSTLPATALAFFGTTIKVGVRDAETNKPLGGAFVVVREFAEVGKLHGSMSYCVRAQAAAADAPSLTLGLPHPGTDLLTKARALEGFAYRPGYCMARIGDARAAASHKYMNVGMAAPPELDASAENNFAMRRAAQTPEERLLHLEQIASGLLCQQSRWGDGSKEAIGKLAEAMTGEANSIARSKYEKHLASRVARRLAIARELPKLDQHFGMTGMVHDPGEARFARDFFVGPANMRVAWGDGSRPVIAVTSAPMAAAAAAPPPGVGPTAAPLEMRLPKSPIAPAPPAPPRMIVHCRHGAPSACDLDERDADGATALHGYAGTGKVDEVRALLEAGADPNATKWPRGDTAMDIVLRQVLLGYANAEKAAQVLDLLAADPRTTIRPALREALADDPSTWRNVHSASTRERLLKRREALLRLPVNPPGRAPGCEDPGFERPYREIPPRLR